MHLDELEILAFAEGEREDLREHVDTCGVCRRAVGEQEAAREALRASGLLEPPPLEPLVAALPARATRRLTGCPRLAAILAPVAVGAVAIAIVTTRGEERTREDATALKAAPAPTAAGDARAAAPTLESVPGGIVRSVRGPVADVVAVLRRRGLDAHRVGNSVEVRRATAARVRTALVDRADGRVPVAAVP